MKIAVTSNLPSLDGSIDPRFGRCRYYLIVNTDNLTFEAVENPSMSLVGGAGIQSAQMLAEKGITHVLTGNCGPNAHQTLNAAGINIIVGCSGMIREVIRQFKEGKLAGAAQPNAPAHFGAGMVTGSPMGSTTATRQNIRQGMGMGRGMGGRVQQAAPAPSAVEASPEAELAQLRETLKSLRQQLAETMERIDQLEKRR